MKFKCKACGKIYDERPQFCRCGNESFSVLRTKAEKAEEELRKIREENERLLQDREPVQEEDDFEKPKEKGVNFFVVLLIFAAMGYFVYYIQDSMRNVEKKSAQEHEYLQQIREEMFKDFDPEGITHSGLCVVSFEINEDGWINKRFVARKSGVPELDNKVMDMLRKTTILSKPPKIYTNKPIKLEFGCSANQTSVECYSKNIVEDTSTQYKK